MVILKILISLCDTKWKDTRSENFLLIAELFRLREFLEKQGYKLKLNIKTFDDIQFQIEEWTLIKQQLSRGYKLKYDIPKDIVNEIETPILIGDEVFVPKILLSEDEFVLEGTKMKNCMGKQFPNGIVYVFISLYLKSNNKRINLQYKGGTLIQSFGKANSPVKKEFFERAIKILTKRLKGHSSLIWKQEKYEIIIKT